MGDVLVCGIAESSEYETDDEKSGIETCRDEREGDGERERKERERERERERKEREEREEIKQ